MKTLCNAQVGSIWLRPGPGQPMTSRFHPSWTRWRWQPITGRREASNQMQPPSTSSYTSPRTIPQETQPPSRLPSTF